MPTRAKVVPITERIKVADKELELKAKNINRVLKEYGMPYRLEIIPVVENRVDLVIRDISVDSKRNLLAYTSRGHAYDILFCMNHLITNFRHLT